MRAVIYARYSTELQRAASIEDQVRLCRARIELEGWTLGASYTDAAFSGASRLRPGYQTLLEDARRGGLDVVVAEALDRLSRDQEDIAGLFKQLSFCGVRLVTLAEGEISELHVGLKGTMNALFLKDLAAKTHRGLEGRVRQGRSGGGNAYGYDVLKEVDDNGDPVAGGRRINPVEADVVRRVFDEYAAGRGPRAIASNLNAEGVPGPGGRPWGDTTIRGHFTRRTGILHNELYVGRLIWNKQRYVKEPNTGKRLARLNPESAWIIRDVPDLRIVDQDLWDRVQARLGAIRESPMVRKSRQTQFWLKRRPKHLLTGLVRCGICDGLLAAVGAGYLACGSARRQGTCSNRRSMQRRLLEDLILDALKRDLMQPEMVKEFVAEFTRATNQLHAQDGLRIERLRRELADVARRLNGLLDAIADGLRSPGLQAKLDELQRRKEVIETDLAAGSVTPVRLHPNLAEIYRRRVENLHLALADEATRAEALEILRSLVERVIVRPINDGFEIELVGEIARMVALGLDGKKAAFSSNAARSVKVVAGIGFEPMTFRL